MGKHFLILALLCVAFLTWSVVEDQQISSPARAAVKQPVNQTGYRLMLQPAVYRQVIGTGADVRGGAVIDKAVFGPVYSNPVYSNGCPCDWVSYQTAYQPASQLPPIVVQGSGRQRSGRQYNQTQCCSYGYGYDHGYRFPIARAFLRAASWPVRAWLRVAPLRRLFWGWRC